MVSSMQTDGFAAIFPKDSYVHRWSWGAIMNVVVLVVMRYKQFIGTKFPSPFHSYITTNVFLPVLWRVLSLSVAWFQNRTEIAFRYVCGLDQEAVPSQDVMHYESVSCFGTTIPPRSVKIIVWSTGGARWPVYPPESHHQACAVRSTISGFINNPQSIRPLMDIFSQPASRPVVTALYCLPVEFNRASKFEQRRLLPSISRLNSSEKNIKLSRHLRRIPDTTKYKHPTRVCIPTPRMILSFNDVVCYIPFGFRYPIALRLHPSFVTFKAFSVLLCMCPRAVLDPGSVFFFLSGVSWLFIERCGLITDHGFPDDPILCDLLDLAKYLLETQCSVEAFDSQFGAWLNLCLTVTPSQFRSICTLTYDPYKERWSLIGRAYN
jgi:hypothetical protein